MSSSSTPSTPAVAARVAHITVRWNPADHSLHSEADLVYANSPNSTHNVVDLTGPQFDYFVAELQKLQPATLLPGTDPLTVASNVARIQHDVEWGRALTAPQAPAQPPLTGTAPDIS